jgi:predicted MFS family arabinose efflux permease
LPYSAFGIGFLFFGWGVLLGLCAVWGAPWMHRRFGLTNAFIITLGVFTAILVALALTVDNHVAVTVLVIACGAPLGVLNTLFTESAMNVSPVPRPVASAGYNFVRFLGAAASPWICGKLGEEVGLSAPFWFGGACVIGGLLMIAVFGRRHLAAINARH